MDDTETISNRYLWGVAVDQVLADEQVEWNAGADDYDIDQILWPLADHLGTVRDLATVNATTTATEVVNTRIYDACGVLLAETDDTVDHLFGFTGRPSQTDIGLQNNLGRWYDPEIASWISEDPISFRGGDANLYRYCGNDLVNSTDPNGLDGSRRWQLMREMGMGPAASKQAKELCHDADRVHRTAVAGGVLIDKGVGDFYRGAGKAAADSVQQTDAMGRALVEDPLGTAGNVVSGAADSVVNADEKIPQAVGDFMKTMISGDNVEKSKAWCQAMATFFGGTRGSFGKRPKKPNGSLDDSLGSGSRLEEVPDGSGDMRHVGAGDAATSGLGDATRLCPDELATGQRLEDLLGKPLKESPHEGAEFVDAAGTTYDALGKPAASKYWNPEKFFKAIEGHLVKSNDFTVIDLTGFTPSQIAEVKNFLDGLSQAQLDKIIRIGF